MSELMSIEEYKNLPPLANAEPREIAQAICDILSDKKGGNIKMLHVEDKTSIAEYFVLCTGGSSTQIKALADETDYKTSLRGLSPTGIEGRGNGSWILLDYGAVIVHIFSREAREFYNLDKLYGHTVKAEDDSITADIKNNENAESV